MVNKMADLLIKGMEMPKSCKECELMMDCDSCEGWEVVCVLQGSFGYLRDLPKDRRDESCPLVEVPAHGELVDRDKLLALMSDEIIRRGGDEQSIGIAWAQSAVEFATTVLEASDSNALNALDALEVEE